MPSAFIWSSLDRFGTKIIALIINIILIRLLDPSEFGIMAIMIIFVNIANQITQNGFNTALIQKKNVLDDDYSSVLNFCMCLTMMIYLVLFFSAPFIESFYGLKSFTTPFRVLALMIFPATMSAFQMIKLKRLLDFRKIFKIEIVSSIIGGVSGIAFALGGFGIWALIAQQVIGNIFTCIYLYVLTRWVPKMKIDFVRIKMMLSYGWKILFATLINTLYSNMAGLVIGKKFSSLSLAYYDRGILIPSQIAYCVNDAIQNVMLPVLSQCQTEKDRCRDLMRVSIKLMSFVFFPIMFGMAAIAPSLVNVLFTDKWSECIPFWQLASINFSFYPLMIANVQVMNALGRSDMFLKVEIVKKILGVTTLLIAISFFDSPIAILSVATILIPLEIAINFYPNGNILGYRFKEQSLDILPNLLLSLVMFVFVYEIGAIFDKSLLTLLGQMLCGLCIYSLLAVVFKNSSYELLNNYIKSRNII